MGDVTRSDELPGLALTSCWPRPDVCVVHLAGEVDIATVPKLTRYLQEQTASLPAHLVLNLAAVSLLAAAGVGMIVTALHNEDGIHGQLHLVGVADSPSVRRVLGMTGVQALIDVEHGVDELLAHLDQA